MITTPLKSTLFPYTTLFRSATITGRSPSCSRRPGAAPRAHARGRRAGRGGRGRSPGRAPSRRPGRSRPAAATSAGDRKSTRLNSSHPSISYAVFCLKKKTIVKATILLNDNNTPKIYTLSLHDALPICDDHWKISVVQSPPWSRTSCARAGPPGRSWRSRKKPRSSSIPPSGSQSTRSSHERRRSEEHTSELQSPVHLVCRLLLEKKNYSKSNYFIK